MELLQGQHVALRPVEPGDAAVLRRIRQTPEVARWWGAPGPEFPEPGEPGFRRFVVLLGDEVAGFVQYWEEPDPQARRADIDVFLAPEHHDKGLGTDALRTIVRHLVEARGHHRITLSMDERNARALRCYEKVGFRRVGVTRASRWDDQTQEWVDELFMELVELPAAPPAS